MEPFLTSQSMYLHAQGPGDVLALLMDSKHRGCMRNLLHADAGNDEGRSAEA